MNYFGTDGMRGKFGIFPMNASCCHRLAQAVECFCGNLKRVILGRDPRTSGEAIKRCLITGFSNGVEIVDAGIITSPLLSKAVKSTASDFGFMITASHNPPEDNGIKIFDGLGEKLSQENELAIEALMDQFSDEVQNTGHKLIYYHEKAHYSADDRIFKAFPKVVIDCANGAAVSFAKEAYRFPQIEWIGVTPNGSNINKYCGSEYPKRLIETVRSSDADLGIAHDGDGDRLLLCDAQGNILSGEVILGIIAIALQRMDRLKGQKIVTTLMANRALECELGKYGIDVVYADVGDRNVTAKMHILGCNLGGESSGHIIFTDNAPTSDGIQTALLFLETVTYLGISLSKAQELIPLWPKKISNLVVNNKVPLEQLPDLQHTITLLKSSLDTKGKIFIRYSGTEYKLRLLVEAETEHLVDEIMGKLKSSIEKCKKVI